MDAGTTGGVVSGPGWARLALRGDIDINTADGFRPAIRTVIDQRPTTIVVDVAEVPFMDSSGLGLLADLARSGRDTRAVIYVVDAVDIVQTAVRACGLDQYVALVASDDPRVSDLPVEAADSPSSS